MFCANWLFMLDINGWLFTFRDSLKLLPSSLDNLASSLCPELGAQRGWEISQSQVTIDNLCERASRWEGIN